MGRHHCGTSRRPLARRVFTRSTRRWFGARRRVAAAVPGGGVGAMTPEFAVWAPAAARVELTLEQERVAMARDDRGWWRAADRHPHHGDRYGFSLDSGAVRPDPRSAWQPDGVD